MAQELNEWTYNPGNTVIVVAVSESHELVLVTSDNKSICDKGLVMTGHATLKSPDLPAQIPTKAVGTAESVFTQVGVITSVSLFNFH